MREETYPFVMQPLPYEYNALSPVIEEETLHIHHGKHYQTYVNNLNAALADYPEMQKLSLKEILRMITKLPPTIQTAVRNQGGGVYNHQMYFDSMKAPIGQMPTDALEAAIERDFGSFNQWKEEMKQAALAQFGSGWAYLVADAAGTLSIVKVANQDVPDLAVYEPLLPLDVWEHAYYLQYRNRRAEYIDGWFRLINWKKVAKRYEQQKAM
ncbi:MAG: superoxide dismutase [Lachnospiraceae bacterium]|jgi:Fe-Mn family superoxide dismutase|nr:superoxide dismutase [Lachnospiraceae bacterium]